MRRKFAETDAKAVKRPTKSAKVSGATNSVSAPKTTESSMRFFCVPRPPWDFILEHKAPNYDDDEDENVNSPRERKWTEILKEARKIWLKPAAEFPGYTWTARKLNTKYDIQTQKRDQDLFGMYIYNDFTGYGLQEVIQNQLIAFNKEYTSDKPSPFPLWYTIEALAWWFNRTDTMLWSSKDQDWPNAITAYAEKHNIEIKGKYGITGKHYPPKKVALVKMAASADKWRFKQRYRKFSAEYGNGGVEFDITKMSEAERRANAFDNKDPLVVMPPVPSEEQPPDADEPFSEVDSDNDEEE
ncbi:hypothetical protein V496_00094 [Pseudogymnoascus sp. VKM F-4515 (FW-2607)]|nr:hypothetical protein V496_00094 [Pseudogymnoascus sp. VKM F-4515 (FW-2607)]